MHSVFDNTRAEPLHEIVITYCDIYRYISLARRWRI